MKIIFVGGGTAGHINPALAMADYVRQQNPQAKILYVGAKGGMEEKLVAQARFPFKGITISGFSRKINLEAFKKNIKTLKNIIISTFESKKILSEFKPDICVGTGGYVCGPFLRKAAQMGIPFLIHDSNSYPGVTTKLLAIKAAKVLIIDKEARKHLPPDAQTVVTGNPVRQKIAVITKSEARENLGLSSSSKVILSFGGSLGAKAINEVMKKVIMKYKDNPEYTFIHGFGRGNYHFKDELISSGIDIKNSPRFIIKEYIKNMPECLAAADLVICRAGATTLSELQASATPAILVPSPNVAENHQFYNAMALVNKNAASIIEEKDLTEEKLLDEMNRILYDNGKLASEYAKNLKEMNINNASERIYKIIEETINKQGEK